jgi:predicted RNase H-like nuclease
MDIVRVAGVDGCLAGWLRIERGEDGVLDAKVMRSVRELLEASAGLGVLAIDVPIGLSENGARLCDVEARRLVGARASSVFPAPVRAVLDAESYGDACARSEAACGKRLSRQTYAILPRIRAMDQALQEAAGYRKLVYEVHPEVSFYFWNDLRPMAHPKRTNDGMRDRLHLVERHFGTVFDELRGTLGRHLVSDDDIVDALAALWTAERVRNGGAVTIPNTPPCDTYGLPMRMVA